MKILISGGNGFLGKYLVKEFVKNNLLFETIGRSSYNNIVADISSNEIFLNSFYDLVIHAAGKAHFNPRSEAEKVEFFKVNVQGTNNLLNELSRTGVPKHFVFISSVSVYGLIEGNLINENSQLLAQDPYGKSKILSEQLVIDWCRKNNVLCTIFRLPLIVGYNPPGNLGSMLKGIKKGYYFNIDGGKAKKSMVLASDVAKTIIKASEVGGTYNLTDGHHPSFAELSHNISSQINKSFIPNMPKFIANILAKIGDMIGVKFPLDSDKLSKLTSDLTFDDSKARVAFGWNPTPVLEGFKINEDVQ
jgi:nucleoside-diphosphate-sugar epimerase